MGFVINVLIPLVAIAAVWFLARYLIKQKAASAPGWKGPLAILQMVLVFAAASLLIPPLAETMPSYLRGVFRVLSFCFGFKTEPQAVLFGFILSLVALGMNRATRVVPMFFLALALLGLGAADLVKIGFPQLGKKAVTGFYGEAVGPIVTPPMTKKLGPGKFLVAFDISTRGPHPTGIKIGIGQYLAFEQVDTTRYEYLRVLKNGRPEVYTATVRGDTRDGPPLYPERFDRPNWFYTKEAAAGSVIFRIGGHGPWFPAFPAGENQAGCVLSNTAGDLWLDINDTIGQGENRYQPGTDGTSCYYDNKGVARVVVDVMDQQP